MSASHILVRARVRLLSEDEGGRNSPVLGSYRPNYNFFEPGNRNMTLGYIELPDGKELLPGESIEVSIALWDFPGLKEELYPGREWRIQEGAKHVGTGTVFKVLT